MRVNYTLTFLTLSLIFVFSLSACGLLAVTDEAAEETVISETEIMEEEKSQEEAEPVKEEKETLKDKEAKNDEPEDEMTVSQEYADKIRVFSPLPGQLVSSPLVVEGEARGMWFFEADFPVKLLDGNGKEIAVHYAEALDEWMTEDFVPFRSEVVFEKPETPDGLLVLIKDNPADKPEYDDEYTIKVKFE